jgi:hypothetical protein
MATPNKKQQTKTRDGIKFDPSSFTPSQNFPQQFKDPNVNKQSNNSSKPIDVKKASQSQTLRKTSAITPTDDMRNILSNLRDIESDHEVDAYPEPEPEMLPSVDVNTKNLPAVASSALLSAGEQQPEFHQVANLPGNMSSAIRKLGKVLFSQFTRTPTEQIWMIGNVMGQGPNTTDEVKAVANYAKKHGKYISDGDIDFSNIMPGYVADIAQYSAGGIRWFIVQDQFGQYIYSWPEHSSLDQAESLPATGKKRIR